MGEYITRIVRDGIPALALRFPSGALKGAGAALAAAVIEEGRLVAGGAEGGAEGKAEGHPSGRASVAWRFETILQDEEGGLVVGPDFQGKSLDEAGSLEEGMTLLYAIARAFSSLAAEGCLPRGLVSPGILVSEAGDVLVLPPSAAARALTSRGAEARLAAVARLASQNSRGPEADASFLLAQAAYRVATGKPAFEREAGEASGLAGSSPSSAPLTLAAPRLDRGLADLADRALADPGAVPLGEWLGVLGAARDAGWTRKLDPELEAELARRGQAAEAQGRSRRGRRDFLRRRGGILIAAAVVMVIAALFVGDLARAQRDKPNFSGLAPRELVERYYLAVDRLDLDSLEACGERKAIKGDDDMLISLVVLTRTRMAYEGKNPLLKAEDWLAAGKPQLAPTDFLFGIAGLSIAEEAPPAAATAATDRVASRPERVAFRATYSLWTLERPDSASPESPAVPTESRRSDLLTLTPSKKGWRIADLERSVRP